MSPGPGCTTPSTSSTTAGWSTSNRPRQRSSGPCRPKRLAALTTALDELESVERREEQRGVWTVDGGSAVTDRVFEFFRNAEEEIVYMTVEGLLTEEIISELRAAADRGVTIRLAGLSPRVQERIEAAVPEAETFESLWDWAETPAGRLLMVDRDRTLVSVLVDDTATDTRSETAIWGSGDRNGLVVVLRAIFTWHLNDERD